MSPALGLILVALLLFTSVAVLFARRQVSARNALNWPLTEATIQLVRIDHYGRNTGNPIYVGDFSYTVGDDYYSGTVGISGSFSTGKAAPEGLANQKFQVHYNPGKPEQFSIPQQEIGGFLLDPTILGI